jgi:hypothetical protein
MTDQLLRVGSLAQPDLQHLPAGHVQGRQATGQMALVAVAEAVVVGEEFFVVAGKTVIKPAHLGVTARMPLPEILHSLFVHGPTPPPSA